MQSGRFLSYSKKKKKKKKRKISQNDRSLSFVVTCCHLLSLVIRSHSLSLTRCLSLYHSLSLVPLIGVRYHSLSFVVTRCHSMLLDVSLICLFYKWCCWVSFKLQFVTIKIIMYSNCAITFFKHPWFVFKNIWKFLIKWKWK